MDNQKMMYREFEDRLEGMTMESPCNNCPEKQLYARMFDMHFSGADCPYECEEYERYLKSSKEDAYAARTRKVIEDILARIKVELDKEEAIQGRL